MSTRENAVPEVVVTKDAEPSAHRLPQAVLRPVRDGNAFEATVEQLATSVRLGVFVVGQQLPPERELAETLGVSRTTLREAIAALREAGMVQTRRGRGGGTVVTYRAPAQGEASGRDLAMTPEQMRDALDFRRVVEPGAAALAASRQLSAEQRSWLVACRQDVERAGHVADHRQADSRLHLAIVTLSGSDLLVSAVTHAQGLLHDMLTAIPVLAPNIGHSNEQHRAVVDAVLGGDPDGARRAMEDHCDATSALLRGLLA